MTEKILGEHTGQENLIIVGIGASAGGLEALQQFVRTLPQTHQFAIVIVQHLDPDHESLMQELLRKQTATPVVVARDGMAVEPGHIYLIAPGESLTIAGNTLHTTNYVQPRGVRKPIDTFFASLADEAEANAVAIIMSGTGTDGSSGARAVKSAGGLVIAQDPEEAKYDGMPRSAIANGCCDVVVPVADMVPVMDEYFQRIGDLAGVVMSDAEFIKRVIRHVRRRTGHDFSRYKPGTLLRRVALRMSVLGIARSTDYLKLLIDDLQEGQRLFQDMLINVTSFFRDKAVYDELRKTVMPDLIAAASGDGDLRIWVPGCSTGQEVYSIAMVAAEAAERANIFPNIAVFGSDIDDAALQVARRGQYDSDIKEAVPADLLSKYFRPNSDGYVVSDALRRMVRFSHHSLVKDPPFSQLNMVSCRNVLIYFDKSLQDSALRVFHYALKDKGILLLGTSETPVSLPTLFEDVSRPAHVYRRLPGPPARLDFLGTQDTEGIDPDVQRGTQSLPRGASQPFATEVTAHFLPPYMAVNARGELLYASDSATRFLRMQAGRPQLNILSLIRPELEPTVRSLLHRDLSAAMTQSSSYYGQLDSEQIRLRVSCRATAEGHRLLVFEIWTRTDDLSAQTARVATDDEATDPDIRDLQRELEHARRQLSMMVEELETSNDELQNANEEMMSLNEELQSANEELTTTNDELNSKIAEMRTANADMTHFIRSTKISTVFLDADLRLRRFTPEARTLFRFVDDDIGRPLDDIGSDLDLQAVIRDCHKVLSDGRMAEADYHARDGRSYRARLVPFSEPGDDTSGVVMSFFDVSELRRLAQEADTQREIARRHQAEVEDLYDVSPQAMAMLDLDLKYVRANQRMADIFGGDMNDLIGRPLGTISPALRDRIKDLAQDVITEHRRIENLQLVGSVTQNADEERVWETDWYPVYHSGEMVGIGLNVRDITDKVRLRFELRRVMQELQHRVKNMLANVLALVSRASRDATADKLIFDTLAQRIQALSQTHKLLTQSNWASAQLLDILKPELTAIYGEDRVRLKGPGIAVNARAALSLGMAVHELATNAAKYGAFSVPDGVVDLSWVRQDDGETERYIFSWKETGGPAPAPVDGGGFGSQLIRSTIIGSLDGNVAFQWEPDGLLCVFTVPVTALTEIPHESVFDILET